jgi:hypothetical protein
VDTIARLFFLDPVFVLDYRSPLKEGFQVEERPVPAGYLGRVMFEILLLAETVV